MSSKSSGIGVFGLLGVLFVGLKLANVIDWSWWWVTAPFWGGFALIVAVYIVSFIVLLSLGTIIGVLEAAFSKKRK
jgi:hypothetical protein